MYQISRQDFETYFNKSVANLPQIYVDSLKNVALIVEDEPSPAQLGKLRIRGDSLLLGLYEGVPLTERQGASKLLPDKITLFQKPIEQICHSLSQLQNQIGRTVWHEIAHYYGLNHAKIRQLESQEKQHPIN
ncbi:MAG: metallopeptidase family protein [Candidatus Saccharimonadales bacterium]